MRRPGPAALGAAVLMTLLLTTPGAAHAAAPQPVYAPAQSIADPGVTDTEHTLLTTAGTGICGPGGADVTPSLDGATPSVGGFL